MTSLRERSIVVVEDSEEDFAAFQRALGRSHIEAEVVRFSDGEAFLAALRGEGASRPPRLVLLDLNLPALGGIEVLEEMRRDRDLRRIPVVILTTSADPRDVQRCYELGVGGYVLKEGDFKDFCGKIDTLAQYWLEAVHQP